MMGRSLVDVVIETKTLKHGILLVANEDDT